MKRKEKAKDRSKRNVIYMQDQIMENIIGRPLKETERVEFINGNTLDCRRANLRLIDDAAPVMTK